MAAIVSFALLVGGLFVSAASAQDSEPSLPEISVVDDGEAADAAEPFDGRATESTVDWVRRTLVGIAVVTGVGLIAFWWHTSPARRLRVATQRAADRVMQQD